MTELKFGVLNQVGYKTSEKITDKKIRKFIPSAEEFKKLNS